MTDFITGASATLMVQTEAVAHPGVITAFTQIHSRLSDGDGKGSPAVRLIVDEDALKGPQARPARAGFGRLAAAGVAVRTDYSTGRLRINCLVRDAGASGYAAKPAVMCVSGGLTEDTLVHDTADALVLRGEKLARVFAAKFEDAWLGNFGRHAADPPRPRGDVTGHAKLSYIDTGLAVRVAFTPRTDPVSLTYPYVEAASRLDFVVSGADLSGTMSRAIAKSLEPFARARVPESGAARSGRTRGLLAGIQTPPQVDAHPFGRLGFPLRWRGREHSIASRFYVIDNEYLIWASAPVWRKSGVRDEATVLVIQNFEAAKAYTEYFLRAFARAEQLTEN